MQNKSSFLPMIQKFILENMPHGGFSFVSKRLNSAGKSLTGRQVLGELRTLKKEVDTDVIYHSIMFLKDNEIEISIHCEDFIQSFKTEKAG